MIYYITAIANIFSSSTLCGNVSWA